MASLIARFRYGKPQSREERYTHADTNTLWWRHDGIHENHRRVPNMNEAVELQDELVFSSDTDSEKDEVLSESDVVHPTHARCDSDISELDVSQMSAAEVSPIYVHSAAMDAEARDTDDAKSPDATAASVAESLQIALSCFAERYALLETLHRLTV